MLDDIRLAGRDAARLKEVVVVASRLGLGSLLSRLGLARDDAMQPDAPAEELPRRVREAMEELGPTFVKLGQILATRADLVPPAWIAELERLHGSVSSLPFETLRPTVEAALGQGIGDAFATVDETPLAAASMAQVHRATLHDGTEVVLKVRRPAIREAMEADLRLIARLAAVAESASAEVRRYAPRAMVASLADALLAELDFTVEGRNADRMRSDFARDPRVVVPTVHWEHSSETLLVLDYVVGVTPRDAAALRDAGIDPAAIAALGADMVLDMVLINGRFHGDPHPGNLMCLPGNRIALLDLGLVGDVSPFRRGELVAFVQALDAGDGSALADVLWGWTGRGAVARGRVDRAAEELVSRHGGGSLVLGAIVADFMAIMRRERIGTPSDLVLIFKALVTIDGVLAAIEPGFDLATAMRRASVRIAFARLSPDRWIPVGRSLGRELARLGEDAPRLLRLLARRLEDPPIPYRDYGQVIATRWLAASVLAGSLVIAAAILVQ